MNEKEFCLLEEPWILVLRADGSAEEVSLIEAFARAPDLVRLAGEVPTQDVAMLRLMIAVLHAVFERTDTTGRERPFRYPDQAIERWEEIWSLGAFPMDVIRSYLEKYRERFYLFHPERPFYQVADMKSGTDYSSAKLNGELSESSNKDNKRLFLLRTGYNKQNLTYSEAARWLINLNSFDDASGKPVGKGLPSPGVGWLGKLGLVFAEGDNLFETLMLNLVMLTHDSRCWGQERPIWELDHPRTMERVRITQPDNQSELLTLQSRRLLLDRKEDKVSGYKLLGGDFFDIENALNEQMTLWRNAEKNAEAPSLFVPKRHDPARHIWRDFSALTMKCSRGTRPGTVSWLAKLKDAGALDKNQFSFRIVSVQYDKKNCSIIHLFQDSLTFSSSILSEMNSEWINTITAEIETADGLANQLGSLARALALAAGDENGNTQAASARTRAYSALDMPFREWLASIDPDKHDQYEVCEKWWSTAQSIVRQLGAELVRDAGPAAFVGRKVKVKNREQLFSAPLAYNWFMQRTASREALSGGGKK